MPSDNIVRPSFGNKKMEPQEQRSAPTRQNEVSDDYSHVGPLTGDDLKRAQQDLLYLRSHMAHVQSMRDKIMLAGDHVFDLRNYSPKNKSIALRRKGLQKNSLEELCGMIENSSTQQWNTEPSFIGALTLEYQCRIDAALSLLAPNGDLK